MPFNQKPQKFNASINTVEIGCGDKAIKLGGECTFPFYTFDAPMENAPKIGVEVSDLGIASNIPGIQKFYEGASTIGEIAKKAETMEGADFVCLRLEGGDPNGVNKSIDERKLLYKNLSIEFYNKNDLQNAFKYAELLFKIDKNDLDNNKIIVNSLKNSNKLCKYIEKIWKYTPYQEAGDLYCNNDIKKAKKLYKMNKKDVESVVYYSNILLNNNMDVDNKIIEYLRQYNDDCVYQLFLRIKNSNH